MEHLPEDNSRYKDVDYWDERYKTEQGYEWLGSFSKFQHLVEKHIKKDDSILVLGCGNSSMSADMYSAGYHSITNIDFSSVCISAMSARHSDCPGMSWQQMDMSQLSFRDESFDVVLEKATLDSVMVIEKNPWNVSPQTTSLIHQALTEVSRILKPGGRFLSITFTQPFFRKQLYARHEYNWSIKHYSYGDSFHYFVYVMTKGEELSPEDAALQRRLQEAAKKSPPYITAMQEEDKEEFLSKIDL
ncbi:EEF1A lysine methyltransferase 4 [Thalassophryne amazonica]|uniref:EEF1A lysine methyltransferase 4 n=1 Tax=Thalassophryne amazonica TaxID=390379 RepID=UPI0014718DEE|nr:EEF1A lysine methyltransferase 4 [Thalassophryne amazonica]XP_034039564.1 EEF1A lysine methyltransferase 4 [Thalassophryne amazonica]